MLITIQISLSTSRYRGSCRFFLSGYSRLSRHPAYIQVTHLIYPTNTRRHRCAIKYPPSRNIESRAACKARGERDTVSNNTTNFSRNGFILNDDSPPVRIQNLGFSDGADGRAAAGSERGKRRVEGTRGGRRSSTYRRKEKRPYPSRLSYAKRVHPVGSPRGRRGRRTLLIPFACNPSTSLPSGVE